MIKKDRRIDGKGRIRTQIRVVEAYRPGLGKPPNQMTIKDFGYLEEQTDTEVYLRQNHKL